ncbi:MAG: protein-L-isoaspartate(D-aspartate) O-methyltransferase [Ghiorsea sp.]
MDRMAHMPLQQGYDRPRNRMVDNQIIARGVTSPRVIEAMRTVQRHLFAGEALLTHAYQDKSLPIGEGQTISQPYMVAKMTELLDLQGHERVLEIGTGCGYQTAVLSKLCKRVYSIERIETLHHLARSNLRKARCTNVMLRCGDGKLGWEDYAPFDAIIVSAGGFASDLWLEQLVDGGCLLLPEGSDPSLPEGLDRSHRLVRRQKLKEGIKEEYFDECTFVPLRKGVA